MWSSVAILSRFVLLSPDAFFATEWSAPRMRRANRWVYTHVHYINLGGQFQCGSSGKVLSRVRLVAEATQAEGVGSTPWRYELWNVQRMGRLPASVGGDGSLARSIHGAPP